MLMIKMRKMKGEEKRVSVDKSYGYTCVRDDSGERLLII